MVVAALDGQATGQPPADKKAPKVVSKTTKQADVALTVNLPESVVVGAPLRATAVLDNQSTGVVHYFESSRENIFELSMKDSQGKAVPLTRFGRLHVANIKTPARNVRRDIAPGAPLTLTVDVGRMFDLSIADTYTLTLDCKLFDEAEKLIRLEIQNVTFTVQEPKR
jgi:hypothetical protein